VAAGRPDAAAVLPQEAAASLATSPVVIAMPKPRAEALGWPRRPLGWTDMVGFARGVTWAKLGHPEWDPTRIAVPDPTRSTAGMLAVLTFLDPDNDQQLSNPELIGGLLLSQLVTEQPPEIDGVLRAYGEAKASEKDAKLVSAFPVLERDLAGYSAGKPAVPLVPVYPKEGTALADHPYAVLKAPWVDQTRQRAAADFLAFARGPAGQRAFAEAGFRDPARSARGATRLAADKGFQLELTGLQRQPAGPSLTQLLGMWTVMQRPNNALVVLDVSGSMNDLVPGTKGTRLELVRKAAAAGVALLNNQTTIGLWAFSTNLTKTTDYRELVAPGPAGELVGGVPRRQAIAGAVQRLRATGGTGLYDTVLAAYLRMQKAWRPNAQNVLVVMTDGRNEDDEGLSLGQLTGKLRKAVRRDRPLPVIGIAVGPKADADALGTISKVTGGRTFVSRDDVGAIQQIVLAFSGRISG
jgi:Ca-activated chloride channel homolog